jgi:hypothetical protein
VSDMNDALGSAEFRAGVRALRDKRQPNFLGIPTESANPP